ncbi:MAG: nickel pincer cofactor biosynthesis protein LarC [Pyrinomonadaceae bacterium]|nr:nickel pincer cofactor biosynthesis protein LarC [Pyrinomonadaceae bacterium]MCX7638831.1 nickel pincer cofactor biosynthesis protein LarC [Pyrinomonadaceae bacterium]MDW8305033.1 nickel pincer cofactor biosynthesis protein LarC [Acidobacteriota bacterium]
MKCLYFDCFSGASGNMILGALISLGLSSEELIERLKSLKVKNFQIDISRKEKSGISAVYVDVKAADEKKHRHLPEIERIIQDSNLSDGVKRKACAIFRRLAEAEAKIHGIPLEKVHFHEVGAIDAIIDVVGACIGFEALEIEKFFCSPINLGSGFVEMAHGKFPVPAPATCELLKGALVYSSGVQGELITPTGAAVISTVCESFGDFPRMKLKAIGYGAGTTDFKEFPNVLRVFLGDLVSKDSNRETLALLETNVDDASPQTLGFLMERVMEEGALDCWFAPIQMKKNRPAVLVSVLCRKDVVEKFCEIIFRETGSLGIRITDTEREAVVRENIRFESKYGLVRLKKSKLKGKVLNIKPEYDDLSLIAKRTNKPIREVEREVLRDLRNNEWQE